MLLSPGRPEGAGSRLAADQVILEVMKVWERIRAILAKKAARKLELRNWKGRCKDSFAELV
jgi:hypothetical protein